MSSAPLPPDIAAALAQRASELDGFAREILWYGEVGSTNDVAAQMADAGAEEGRIIVADTQTAGRGRLGRRWVSPAGAGLYVSVILRPQSHALPLVTLAAGVAVAEGIFAAAGLETTVKWPNDVYVGPRKLAGILAERGASPHGGVYIVLGIGINVLTAAYPPEIAGRATAIETELGRAPDRGLVLADTLRRLAARYAELQRNECANVVGAWRQHAASTFGRPAEWDGEQGVEHGIVEGVDDEGGLLVRTMSGRRRITSGEVRWR